MQETRVWYGWTLERAAKYMQMEELALYGNQVQAETTSTKKEVDKPIFYNAKEEGGRDQLPREPRYAHYTPLNVSRSHILDQALAIETLVMSKRANTPPKVGFSMRCWYHQNRGYSIEECGVLKDKIEYLIKLGHLKDFVHMQDQDSFFIMVWERKEELEDIGICTFRYIQFYFEFFLGSDLD